MSGHDGPDISAVYQLLSEVARRRERYCVM
jgi:hypothetical protein